MLSMRHIPLAAATLWMVVSQSALADWETNMPVGVTEISRSVHDLHMTIFWICVAIGVVVFGVMFWSILHHRKSKGAVPAQFHESTTVEIIWTLIPFVILIAMAVPATATLIKMYNTDDAELDVKITGYQWKWHYEYMGEDVAFFSNLATPNEEIHNQKAKNPNYLLEVDEPLVLPVGKKIRFLLTANDVIHAWWVPALAVKKDAIPGFINESWTIIDEPGIYRGQCAELCGQYHGFMPIVVKAVPEAEFRTWLAARKAEKAASSAAAERTWTREELIERGQEVYMKACAACHQPTGAGIPGAFPALTNSPVVNGPVEAHAKLVIHGVQGTAMQAFGAQLDDVDLASVITFERNALGNSTGDMISPQEIRALKAK